jgi:hypothetical protein
MKRFLCSHPWGYDPVQETYQSWTRSRIRSIPRRGDPLVPGIEIVVADVRASMSRLRWPHMTPAMLAENVLNPSCQRAVAQNVALGGCSGTRPSNIGLDRA